jgi:hypothetical protein
VLLVLAIRYCLMALIDVITGLTRLSEISKEKNYVAF